MRTASSSSRTSCLRSSAWLRLTSTSRTWCSASTSRIRHPPRTHSWRTSSPAQERPRKNAAARCEPVRKRFSSATMPIRHTCVQDRHFPPLTRTLSMVATPARVAMGRGSVEGLGHENGEVEIPDRLAGHRSGSPAADREHLPEFRAPRRPDERNAQGAGLHSVGADARPRGTSLQSTSTRSTTTPTALTTSRDSIAP